MKRILRYLFASKYSLLFAAIVLFFLSYVFNTYYTNLTSVSREKKLLENYIHKQQQDYADFLKDTSLLRKLVQNSESLDEFKKIAAKQYGIFLFAENAGGDFNMLFWSDQLILPPQSSFKLKDGESFDKLVNGYYVIHKNTIKLDGVRNTIIAFALIPVQFEYYVEIPDLPKEFAYSKTASQVIAIAHNKVTPYAVYSISGNVLFYLDKKAYVAIPSNDAVTLILRLSGLFLLLLFIHLIAESLAQTTKAWKAIVFLAGCLILLRGIIYRFPFLFNLRQFALFDPAIYGSDIILRSLGDLLVNAVIFCWIVVFAWSKISHKTNFGILSTKGWKWVVGAFALIMLILSTFLLANTIRGMVADSRISFNVSDFDSIDIFSIVGFIVLACLSLGYYYFTQILFRLIFPVFEGKAAGLIYFVIATSGLIYLTTLATGLLVQFFLFVLIWLIIYTWLISRQAIIFQRFQINIAGVMFWIFVFSASISVIMLKENQEKEWQRRKAIAEKISAKFDETRANELKIAMVYLDNKFWVNNFHRLSNADSSKFLRDSIIRASYQNYGTNYDTKVFVFDRNKTPLNNEDPDTYDALNTILTVQARPIEKVPDLFTYETSYDKISYITRREVKDSLKNPIGDVFIISIPKKYGGESMLPQLFKQYDEGDPENSQVYSYALYSKSELISSSSKYPFVTSLTNNQVPKNEFEKRKNGDYDEMWYKDINEKVVVIARKEDSTIESITLFSWIFCSFLFMVTVVQLVSLLLKAGYNWKEFRRLLQMNIRTQIHVTFILISLLSFIIIGVATISFFYSRFSRSNVDKLSRTMKVMVNEMQKKLIRQNIINDTINVGDSFYVEKEYDLKSLVNEVAEIHNVDVNIYDLNGDLEVSSEANVYKRGVLSTKMNPEAFYHLSRMREVQHVQQERVGDMPYTSIYAPVRTREGGVDSYLNIPYFTSQNDLNQEISNFLVTLINLNAFTFLIAGVIALFITNRITRSFSLISEKMKEVNLGQMNEEIIWNRDDEIGELVKEYNKMVAKLEESASLLAKTEREGAWREMARQVAHEIKNPLTPMKLSIQYLQKAVNSNQPNVKELSSNVANTLVEQIDHLSRIAADFSQFANIGNVNVENFDLHDVIGSLKDLYEPDNQVQFIWHPLDRQVMLNADKTQMNRLFTNLFTNAVEACDGNTCRIEVNEMQENGTVKISIKDNGEGIAPEMQSKIFVPNFTTKSSGTGLGLAMCKSIVEQAKGKIWFETQRGRGTTFHVELPVEH
ncbi:MAG: GHKL domain-containing protein [Bacteroidetes bacterium]|nr:GHKL domain-containing protein [Bacteroidota bacterium]